MLRDSLISCVDPRYGLRGRAAPRSWRATWTSLCTRQTSSTSTSSITLTRLTHSDRSCWAHSPTATQDRLLHHWAVWLQLRFQQLSDIRRDGFCYWSSFLETFAKLRKATISHVLPVGLFSWGKRNSLSTGRIFIKFEIRVVLEKVAEKIPDEKCLLRGTNWAYK